MTVLKRRATWVVGGVLCVGVGLLMWVGRSGAQGQAIPQGVEEGREPATKLEAFLGKRGILIVKDWYEVGQISGRFGSGAQFSALVIYEPGQEAQRIRGLKVEVTEGGRYERSEASFLDLEEVESLSQALGYMVALSEKWKGVNREYTEVIFSTKGDFRAGFYQRGAEMAAFCYSGYVARASCFLESVQDLTRLKAMADKGLEVLSEK